MTTSTSISNSNQEQENSRPKNDRMSIIERKNIPQITSIKINGQEHSLGLVKDFRKDPILASFLPEKPERISFSWVRLLSSETLAVHSHPTASLIIICEGEGYCTGDISGYLESGSIVVVPPNCLHGFCGAGSNGFWGLSLQLESLGLYESINSPRVMFNRVSNKSDNMELLLEAHNFFMLDFKRNSFFQLLESKSIGDSIVLDQFLDNILYFSKRFQSILKTRLKHANSEIERRLAIEHLEEEKDHDVSFARSRGNPVLNNIHQTLVETADWFESSMVTLSDAEKIVLMHFVLEGSGQLAHSAVHKRVRHLPVAEHFELHQEEDEEHFLMGVEALKIMDNLKIEHLLTTLITGWSNLNKMCACMADSAQSQARKIVNTSKQTRGK